MPDTTRCPYCVVRLDEGMSDEHLQNCPRGPVGKIDTYASSVAAMAEPAPEPSTCYITCPDCKRIHKLGECAQPPITVGELESKLLELMQRFPVQVGRCKKIARELKSDPGLKGRSL